jgi:thiol-disulfide isomerase/thioredoxin
VISFWATWCKPCTTPEELVLIGQLQRELGAASVGFLNLAVDDLSKVRGDARAPGWVYPVWQADDAHIELLPEAFIRKSGLGLPLFLVVDGRGVPRFWRNRNLDLAGVEELVALARGL